MRTLLHRAAAAALLMLGALGAQAQGYPTKPIRFIITTAPGGGTDGIGRMLADALSATLKQPVVPDNRAGASGMIGADALARSAPDGYTLAILQNVHTSNPAFYRKLPYDTLKDFSAIAPVATSPLVLVAATGTGVGTVQQLIALGKREPQRLSFATAESSSRLAVAQMAEATGLPMAAVPYKGTGPAVSDVAAGHVNFSVTTMASALPFKGTGKLNFVAVLDRERSPFLPEVPTLVEQGLSGVEARGWWGLFGPAHLPEPLVARLNDAIRSTLRTPQAQERLRHFSATPWVGTAQELDAFVRAEVPAVQHLARKAGIEAE